MSAVQQKVLDALGDPTRRAIFEKLGNGPLAVVDISKRLPVTRSAVSQHLKILKAAGLVLMTQEGTKNIYKIDTKGILALREYLDQFWNVALDSFKTAVEVKNGKQK